MAKIEFRPLNCVPDAILERNRQACARRNLPIVGGDIAPRLAVVGGGPSVANHLSTLQHWGGEVWAINGAWRWCRDNGIDAIFYSLDPAPCVADFAKGAKRAILLDACDPSVFDVIDGAIEVFPYGPLPCGSTSASTAPMIAAMRGNVGVTMFGCESSFTDSVHVYSWGIEDTGRLLVACGGQEFLTTPQFIMQAEYLADVVRGVDGYVRVACGGFLAALVEHGDYDVLKVSRDIAESLNIDPEEGVSDELAKNMQLVSAQPGQA